MKRIIVLFCAFLASGLGTVRSQGLPGPGSLQPICDSLAVHLKERTSVTSNVRLSRVLRRAGKLDLYFTSDLGDYPWHSDDLKWFRAELGKMLKDSTGYEPGELFVRSLRLDEFRTAELEYGGVSARGRYNSSAPPRVKLVTREGEDRYSKGLDGRTIALWQSHGIYFRESSDEWTWQRARLHRTVEDMFTQSYVLPFLVPMLERAGAYVLLPRERDTGRMEYITDGDRAFGGNRSGLTRRRGSYSERGGWTDAGEGFADARESYSLEDNPFKMGRARMADCSPDGKAVARWNPDIADRGNYAVYVSYKAFGNSNPKSEYTVHHMGGDSRFLVDQTRGGGTWMYLGSFEMDGDSYVTLSNKGPSGQVVSADAVKIGGGMGKIARGPGDGRTSGRPSYMEGALYWLCWAGADSTVTRAHETDYTNDYASRGPWVEYLYKEKNIPFDLTLAFHSDAGATPNDSTVGTLAIYTLTKDRSRELLNGADRMSSRQLADFVQTQICRDLRIGFNPDWSRRMLWDRNYSESRTSGTPAMILELLSHQNFADMRYGHDPSFKFAVSRAVYKGMLKFLSSFYGEPYAVQPLPVHGLKLERSAPGKARLSWIPTEDDLEPTAVAKSYIVYTRRDGGAFDTGRKVSRTYFETDIQPGHIYSFKVEAVGDGGRSFPSETLSVGIAPNEKGNILIVNNFTRVSAPYWFDGGDYAGFDARIDSGVPWISDLSYIGENYEYRRNQPWITDDNGGHGSSWDDKAGMTVAGNSFDYPYVHGLEFLQLGYSFTSMSSAAFCALQDAPQGVECIDLICGKQVTVPVGNGREEFRVFPEALQEILRKTAGAGVDILVSGSKIATDVWSAVYPVETVPEVREAGIAFVKEVLGYQLAASAGTRWGSVAGMEFYCEPNEESYCVEMPDAITPADRRGETALRYDRTGLGAAVRFRGDGWKVFSAAVPVEAFKDRLSRLTVIAEALKFFEED